MNHVVRCAVSTLTGINPFWLCFVCLSNSDLNLGLVPLENYMRKSFLVTKSLVIVEYTINILYTTLIYTVFLLHLATSATNEMELLLTVIISNPELLLWCKITNLGMDFYCIS